MLIFICIIIGIIIFYKVIVPLVHNQYNPYTEKRITKGLLSMSFWQILFGILVCAYAFDLEPVYKQTDADVNSFVQEYSEIGELINEYTGINTSSNFNYLMSETDNLHTYAVIFVIITVILSLATAIGSIGRKLDRRIIEGLAIFNTLACCWITKSSTDLYELIVRDGVTLQTIAWIGRLLGTDIYSSLDLIIRSVWILPLILIIKHFYYHKALNEYYALPAPQPKQIKENNSQEQPDIQQEEQINENNPEPEEKPVPISQPKENSTLIGEPVIVEKKSEEEPQLKVAKIEEIEKKPSVPFNLLFAIGLVVLMGLVGWWILQNNEKENYIPAVKNQTESTADKDIYEQRAKKIIQELTSKYGDKIQVEHKYPELSKYCTFNLTDDNTNYLLIYDLDREILKQFDTQSLPTNNAGEVCLFFFSTSMNQNDDILISGNNGAHSMGVLGFTEYRLELNTTNWDIKEICSGNEIIKTDYGYIARKAIVTRFKDDARYNEYTIADVYYDLQGNLIAPSYSGNNYQLKGLIDNKYSITMQLSIQDNKIYGKYYYDKNGSDNYLYLYGGISESGDAALLEFNNEGQQTSNFKGRFTENSFDGIFTNYNNKKMPFELHTENNGLLTTKEIALEKYYNSRFGYSTLYPSSFSNIRESENGDGCRFSKDDHTYLITYGMYNVSNETINDKYNERKSKSPVYCRLKDNWFIISDYTENGDIFYLKTVLKDEVFVTAELHYPSNEKEFYSKLIPKIFADFPN